MDPIQLSMGQQFDQERMSRLLDATDDPRALRAMAKQLLVAFFTARAATDWVISQQKAPRLDHEEMAKEVAAKLALGALQNPPAGAADVVAEWDDPLI
jgi:hypothetical protein